MNSDIVRVTLLLALLLNAVVAVAVPPSQAEGELAQLLAEVMRNQRRMNAQLGEYTALFKSTLRSYDRQGKLDEEIVWSGENYQSLQRNIEIRLAKNGQPLTDKKIEQERQRAIQSLTRDAEARQRRVAARPDAEGPEYGASMGEVHFSSFAIIRGSETYNLREARWQGRRVLLVDFRPRPGFTPPGKELKWLAQLVGTLWIDADDKVVVKMQARLPEAAPGDGVIFHQELIRMPDGVWLSREMQINCSPRPELCHGLRRAWLQEFSRHQKFTAQSTNEKLDTPVIKQ